MARGPERSIIISGSISDQIVPEITASVMTFVRKSKTKPISVYINSDGGDLNAMFAIHDILRTAPCPVHTYGFGHVMSAGTLLLACGDTRYLYENALVMMHEPMFSMGEDSNINIIMNEIKINSVIRDKFFDLMEIYLDKPKADLISDLSQGDKFMTSSEAHLYGLVDYLIPVDSE
jgi:ATP-dependent Clp protease protease subunit